MKRKKEIQNELNQMKVLSGLSQYDLGWRAGYRKALEWVLKK
jgi:hypothetical protein